MTPLQRAVENGHKEICKLIIDQIECSSFIAKSLQKYQALNEKEISFGPGQLIANVHELNPELWFGVGPDGNYGSFPANHAEVYGQPTKIRKMG